MIVISMIENRAYAIVLGALSPHTTDCIGLHRTPADDMVRDDDRASFVGRTDAEKSETTWQADVRAESVRKDDG